MRCNSICGLLCSGIFTVWTIVFVRRILLSFGKQKQYLNSNNRTQIVWRMLAYLRYAYIAPVGLTRSQNRIRWKPFCHSFSRFVVLFIVWAHCASFCRVFAVCVQLLFAFYVIKCSACQCHIGCGPDANEWNAVHPNYVINLFTFNVTLCVAHRQWNGIHC